jgi:orotidine-5'-phosphate decarboxylase
MDVREKIILPLDVDNAWQALHLVEQLKDWVGAFKVGLELVNAAGIVVLEKLRDAGAKRIFYDAKVHDIPNTVAGTMRAIARQEIWMTNVHACGGLRMIRAAADALEQVSSEINVEKPILLGVTLLTSIDPQELGNELHVSMPVQEYVVALAQLVQKAGGNGVVASPKEIEGIRSACGSQFLIVTPGVRPRGSETADQRRTMTPAEAVRAGANYLVIGRPITAAPDPLDAVKRILDEIA